MPSLRLLILALASCSLVACGAIPEGKVPQEGSAYSSATSSSASAFSASPSVSSPSEGTVRGIETASNLVVKPDEVRVCFTLRALTSDAPKALDDFRGISAELERRFKETVAKDAKLVMKNVNVTVAPAEGSSKKSADGAKSKHFSVVATGVVELVLPENASYWERARVVGSAAQLAALFTATYDETPVRAIVTHPEILVKSPEAHRKTLLDKWVRKSQELSKTAKIAGSTLDFTSCTPPGDVQQRALSLEEAELTLPVACEPLRASLEKNEKREK